MQNEHLLHTLHENGIHEFQFLKSSRAAVDGLYEVMIALMETSPRPTSFLLLIDATNGMYPPFRHLFAATQEFADKYTDAPPAYTAVVANPNVLMTLVDNFMQTLSKYTTGYNSLRFFQAAEYDQALARLLSIGERTRDHDG